MTQVIKVSAPSTLVTVDDTSVALTLSNERGPQGPLGPTGPQGIQGPAGSDATVPQDLIDAPDLVILFENGLT